MAKLIIEFPMRVLSTYNGGLENLDITLDDNITYFLCTASGIASILESDIISSIVGESEELYRYCVDYKDSSQSDAVESVVHILPIEKYVRGCTIRSSDGAILRSDEHTADILERRRIKGR